MKGRVYSGALQSHVGIGKQAYGKNSVHHWRKYYDKDGPETGNFGYLRQRRPA